MGGGRMVIMLVVSACREIVVMHAAIVLMAFKNLQFPFCWHPVNELYLYRRVITQSYIMNFGLVTDSEMLHEYSFHAKSSSPKVLHGL